MRILVLQDYLRCGGTEGQSIFLSQFFQSAQHDVHLLTFRPGGALEARLKGGAVQHTALQPFDTHLTFFAPRLTRTVSDWCPDVVLCMGRTANIYGGALQASLPNIMVIGTVRTGKKTSFIELRALKRMCAVITNTEWWRRRLIDVGLRDDRVAVVRNALIRSWNGADRKKLRAATRNRLDAAPSTVVLLNVAAFRRGKRHELLLEIVSQLGPEVDWQLWLVGEGRRWRSSQRRAQKLKISDRVRFIGFCDDPLDYYAGADIAVSASVRDALPNFIVEAQHMGLATVATDFRGVGEIVRDGETGFLIGPDAHEVFVQRVRELIENAELRSATGQRAAELAKMRFSRETQARAFLDTLVEFAANADG